MDFLIRKEQVKEWLPQENIKIIDCRFNLQDPLEGERKYERGHVPGAHYFDLEKQLSGTVKKHGGRHPLPDLKKFQEEIERAGIDRDKKVVVYDDGDMQFASRFWWLLTYLGHEKVYLLEEGYKGWEKAGFPITKEIPEAKRAHFERDLREEMLASYEEVKQTVAEKGKGPALIDSRAKERYAGESEPMDRIPGHIPGAIHKFWEDSLEEGFFKDETSQQERFNELDPEAPVIVYCGSGVTAAPNFLALKKAGFKQVKLYAGSYSDWVSYEDNPVHKGSEE